MEQGRGMKLVFVRHISLADMFAPVSAVEATQGRTAGSIKKGLASLARGVNAAFGNAASSPDLTSKVPSSALHHADCAPMTLGCNMSLQSVGHCVKRVQVHSLLDVLLCWSSVFYFYHTHCFPEGRTTCHDVRAAICASSMTVAAMLQASRPLERNCCAQVAR